MRKLIIPILTISILVIATNASAQSYNKADSKYIIEYATKSGVIERIDMNRHRVYVNHGQWVYVLDARSKELLVHLAADYFRHHDPSWNQDGRPHAQIYSNRTGKRVARWTTFRGVRLD